MGRLAVASMRMFLQCAAGCCTGNFLVLYLRHRGLGEHQIGLIVGLVSPLATMLGAPLWTGVADVLHRPKLVMMASLVLGSAGYASVLAVPSSFAWIAGVAAGATFLRAAVDPMLDAAVTSALALERVPLNDYGRYRLWGGLGWGVAAGGLGPLLDKWGIGNLFYAYGVLVGLFFLAVAAFEFRTDGVHEDGHSQRIGTSKGGSEHEVATGALLTTAVEGVGETAPLLTGHPSGENGDGRTSSTGSLQPRQRSFWGPLLCGEGVALFMFFVLAMGVAKGVIDAFLFLWLQELGATNTLSGLTLVVTVVGEVPFFFCAGDIIDRITPTGSVLVALVAYAGRLYYYSRLLDGHAVMVLPAELLHGITWALSWVAVVTEAKRVAPPGLASATQGVFQALFWGLGFGVGAVSGGFWYASFGARSLFFWTAVLSAGACVLGAAYLGVRALLCRRGAPGRSGRLDEDGGLLKGVIQ